MRPTGEPVARTLRTPRVAGAAGIAFGLLLGIMIILVRLTLPTNPGDATSWLTNSSRREALRTALNLLPFAVIFFLWFMGVIRDHVGAAEDKFFATLFLCSGVLFVTSLLIIAAAVASLLATAEVSQAIPQIELWQYVHYFVLDLLSNCSMRMAAVFAIATSTIGKQLDLFPRWLVWLGYSAALVLFFVVGSVAWFELVFPVWVLVVSGYLLRSRDEA